MGAFQNLADRTWIERIYLFNPRIKKDLPDDRS